MIKILILVIISFFYTFCIFKDDNKRLTTNESQLLLNLLNRPLPPPTVEPNYNSSYNLAIDKSGNVYAAGGSNAIVKITPTGDMTVFAGSNLPGYVDGTGTNARFNAPSAVAIDSSGNLFVTDRKNKNIRKITPEGVVTTFKSLGVYYLNNLAGITIDSSGNIYFSSRYRPGTIDRITSTGVLSTFAGSFSKPYGSVDGIGNGAKFSYPAGLTIDSSGNIFVADAASIRKITPGVIVTTVASLGKGAIIDGVSIGSYVYSPDGVTVDSSGNIFVAVPQQYKILKITPDGVVTTFAGSGLKGRTDGTRGSASFYRPTAVAADNSGNLYVVDYNTIRKITSAGIVTTIVKGM